MKKEKKASISIEEFNYNLPDEKVAKYPLKKRDESKLLFYKNGQIEENVFKNITHYLPENTLLVYNNTRVIQARLFFQKPTGAKIEIFCLEPSSPSDYALSLSSHQKCTWKCMIGNKKKWKEGLLEQRFSLENKEIIFTAEKNSDDTVTFCWNDDSLTFGDVLTAVGELPIPPYLHRKTEKEDKVTYQTVYSKIEGSVAAPTAGLHFTDDVFQSLKTKNISCEELTLHVGAGTFKPVQSENVSEHTMHTERIIIRKSMVQNLLDNLGQITAVGTTSVRTLESLYFIGCNIADDVKNPFFVEQWQPYLPQKKKISTQSALHEILNYMLKNDCEFIEAETQILIQPSYEFHLVNAIITNFHQPKSTLLLLVSAFVGDDWLKIYNYALAHNFRFLSYGDSSLLVRKEISA